MERAVFAQRLRDAAGAARDFASQLVRETLPSPIRFRVRLNRSYDATTRGDNFRLFRDDSGLERASSVSNCCEAEAIDALWRDGLVPQWIDVAVIGETGEATFVELVCCGRFTADEQRLYHASGGLSPFQVTGPVQPPRHAGERFSIHHRAECWSRDELELLRRHTADVWSLELIGNAIDDQALLALPELPALELLDLKWLAMSGHGLADLDRHAQLRVVRIALDPAEPFEMPELTELAGVDVCELADLPAQPWGSTRLFRAVPRASRLAFRARGTLALDGVSPRALSRLTIAATELHGDFALPARLESLALHLTEASDADIDRLFAPVAELGTLDLAACPVGDELAERLADRFDLRYLGLAKTRVSAAAVARIAAAHPKLRLR